MVEEVGELELEDGLSEWELRESRDDEDGPWKDALAALI
jgi:hypothetical protein